MKKFLAFILLFLACNSISFAQTDQEIFENGVHLFKQGMYKKAVDQFSTLIERSPENADAYKNRGVSYMKLEKYDLAIKDFQKARTIFPELKDLYSNLGVAWYYKNDCEKAVENYNLEIQMSPENPVGYFNRALCLVEQGKPGQAEDDLNQTLKLQPDFYWAICLKADLLSDRGDPFQAIELYEKALQIDPENTYPSEKMAQLKSRINQKDNPSATDVKPVQTSQKQPAPEEKDEIKKGYEIQTGAFQNRVNAEEMHTRLQENGYDSRIRVLSGKNNTPWYVVRIGSFSEKTDAEETRTRLKQKMKMSSYVTPKGRW